MLTWGQLHHPVDPLPLAHVILRHAPQLSLETHVTGVRLCNSLREAAVAPRFFECLVALSREQVVRGRGYPAWRRHKIALLDLGKDIWFAGVADVADLPPPDLRSTDPVSAQEFNHEPPSPFDRPTSVEPRHWATDRLECHVWIWSGSAWSPTMPEAVEFPTTVVHSIVWSPSMRITLHARAAASRQGSRQQTKADNRRSLVRCSTLRPRKCLPPEYRRLGATAAPNLVNLAKGPWTGESDSADWAMPCAAGKTTRSQRSRWKRMCAPYGCPPGAASIAQENSESVAGDLLQWLRRWPQDQRRKGHAGTRAPGDGRLGFCSPSIDAAAQMPRRGCSWGIHHNGSVGLRKTVCPRERHPVAAMGAGVSDTSGRSRRSSPCSSKIIDQGVRCGS